MTKRNEVPECYRCASPGTTREHFPPKCFFPKGAGLNLRTVPSCPEHNNGKSSDDMYVLVQICLHASRGDNLARQIFMRSVVGALKRSPAFRAALNDGAEWLDGGARRYKVSIPRFDAVFDSLCSAIYFDRYGRRFDPNRHAMNHVYLNFKSDDEEYQRSIDETRSGVSSFFARHARFVEHNEADKLDEVIYANQIIDPLRDHGSITIAHSFYGCFEVLSFLSTKAPLFFVASKRP